MANPYYNVSGTPGQGAPGASSPIRAEYASIASGFDKMPTLAGNANRIITVNSGATALVASTLLAISGAVLTVTGDLTVTGTTLLNGAVTVGDAAGDALTINPSAISWPGNPTHSGNHTYSGNLTVNGNTAIGNAAADTLTITAVLASNLAFDANNTRAIGASGVRASNIFSVLGDYSGAVSAGSLTVTGAAAFNGGTTIGDAAGDAFTINSNTASVPNGLTFSGNVNVSGTLGTGALTVTDLTTTGNTILGNASGDTFTVTSSAVSIPNGLAFSGGNVTPAVNNAITLGTTTGPFRWANVISVLGSFSGTISSTSQGTGFDHSVAAAGILLNNNIFNTSNSASSSARLSIITGGASGGNPEIRFGIAAVQDWILGVNNADADAYVISASGTLGTTNVLRISTAGAVSIPLGDLDVTRSSAGSVGLLISNPGAGDAVLQWAVSGAQTWTAGADNSASDSWVLSTGTALGTNNAIEVSTAGAVNFPRANVSIIRSDASNLVSLETQNLDNTANSRAWHLLRVGGASAGDAFTTYEVAGGGTWSMGVDNSDSDAWVLAASAGLGTTNVLRATAAGALSVTGILAASQLFLGIGEVTSGTYTPTFTAGTNVAAVVANGVVRYIRTGAQVFVSGACSVDPTAATTQTAFGISLPFASAMTVLTDLSGMAKDSSGIQNAPVAEIYADFTNDRANVDFFNDANVANRRFTFNFTYSTI